MATLRRIDHNRAKSGLPAGDDSPKVLYVEDDETNFDIARSILGEDFDVDWASSSDQAIDKLGTSFLRPDFDGYRAIWLCHEWS